MRPRPLRWPAAGTAARWEWYGLRRQRVRRRWASMERCAPCAWVSGRRALPRDRRFVSLVLDACVGVSPNAMIELPWMNVAVPSTSYNRLGAPAEDRTPLTVTWLAPGWAAPFSEGDPIIVFRISIGVVGGYYQDVSYIGVLIASCVSRRRDRRMLQRPLPCVRLSGRLPLTPVGQV